MTVAVIGGDKRSFYLVKYLKEYGYEVKAIGVPDILSESVRPEDIRADAIILPIPVSKDGEYINCNNLKLRIDEIFPAIKNSNLLCGGVIPETLKEYAQGNNTLVYDFMTDNEVACKNAVATAEGAIMDAFMLSDNNIEGSKSLVTGWGRCAKVLAAKLNSLGSLVTVMARNDIALSEAAGMGYKAINFDEINGLGDFNYCFNTVPAMVLTEELLKEFSSDIVIIDIASRPGGTDFSCCDRLGITYRHSLGIPGRYSPDTSGKILAEAFIKKEGK